ncbi:MAG: tRNA guanosine(34) transglycosylase Tgt [Chlamydiae bacterium]|nr:tRNA guanosine(34) transglycosylase Tgt [Chlamydiota bacterium]
MRFIITAEEGSARCGQIITEHGAIETPVFMPVGTRASVKAVTNRQLLELDTRIILGNTYHLMLRPGANLIAKAGGLHNFMNWPNALLTDSGGYQVFSLSALNKITDKGVHFQSHIDGSRHFLGPQESMDIQHKLGSDIVMAFDECSPYPASYEQAAHAVKRTTSWAKICRDYPLQSHQNLFAIIQGGTFAELRQESVDSLLALDCEGYAIGGLSVGEPAELMYQMLDVTTPLLPWYKPRYLMGVGTPRNIIEAVMRGVDMFDCVMPTRNARNGTAFTWQGKIQIKAAKYREDFSPLDPELSSEVSGYTKAYLRHLCNIEEITAMTLITLQNIAFYLDFMKKLRLAIREGSLASFYTRVCQIYPS